MFLFKSIHSRIKLCVVFHFLIKVRGKGPENSLKISTIEFIIKVKQYMWNLTVVLYILIQLKMITDVTVIIIIIKLSNLVMGDNLSLNGIVILSICEF